MNVGNSQIQWSDKVKYLGITLMSSKSFKVDFSEIRRKFFITVNSILCKCKYTTDIVQLELLETQCFPVILYTVESLDLKASELKELNSWWNSVYRKIFTYNK